MDTKIMCLDVLARLDSNKRENNIRVSPSPGGSKVI